MSSVADNQAEILTVSSTSTIAFSPSPPAMNYAPAETRHWVEHMEQSRREATLMELLLIAWQAGNGHWSRPL
jgi:hypothetical protein